MNTEQIFVITASLDQLILVFKNVMFETGFLFCEHELPRLISGSKFKKYRHFLLSNPINDWVCIVEDRIVIDKQIAESLSTVMKTKSIWFSYSETVEECETIIYENGMQVERSLFAPKSQTQGNVIISSGLRRRSPAEIELFDAAEEIYKKNLLPFPFYNYKQIDASRNKEEYFLHLNFQNSEKL